MPLVRSLVTVRGALLCALLAVAACKDDEPSTPAQLTPVTGASVTGRAGEVVTVTVHVAASNGRALGGQSVAFTPTTGGGTVNPATATTDANGDATTQWTLGRTVGVQTLNASVGTLTPLTITATASPGRPASAAAQAGNTQSAPVGTTVATRPSVVVRDAAGNAVQGVQVIFSVASGGGTVTGDIATTDASGIAAVGSWQLGSTAGANTLIARVFDTGNTTPVATVTFTATGTPLAPARAEVADGSGITATVGSSVTGTNLPSVLVTDINRNPVANATVTFTVTSGGGNISNGTATTNANGIATLSGFTLGTTAGANIITATTTGASPVTFTITGTPAAAARVEIVGGNNQEARAGNSLTAAPTVRVVDQFGNPVPGATVTFAIATGGGSVLGATQTTNAQGIAAAGGITLGTTPGTNTFTARSGNATPASFTATGLAGPAATITRVTAGDTLQVNAFDQTVPLTVLVRDADGFPVRGATVTFAVDSAKAGTISPTTATTDAQGQASARLTAAAVVDTATITATVGTLAPVTFTVVIAPNAAATVREIQGNNQAATAGTMVALNPTVEVRDSRGNPVAGLDVFFGVVTTNLGGGLLPPTGSTLVSNGVLVPTDANGRASVGWQLGGTPGDNVLTAVVQAGSVAGNPIRFTARGTAVPAAGTTIAIVAGDAQTTTAGALVPTPPAVVVKNAGGQPLANVTVEFIPSAGSTVNGVANSGSVQVQTDASGVARLTSWRLSSNAGVNTLTASVVGAGVSVLFTGTGQ